MTPEEAEAYTRARWERVYGGGEIAVTIYAEEKACHFLNYIAAAEFTKQREEEIRQKRFDIDHVTKFRNFVDRYCREHPYTDQTLTVEIPNLQSWNRILAVLEAQLAALLVGWKG